MALLSLDHIKAAFQRPKLRMVPVPEWGEADAEVMVRGMSGTQRIAYQAYATEHPEVDFRLIFVAFVLCDAAGNLLFAPEDAGAVGTLDAIAFNRVFSTALDLNDMSRARVEALEKN